MSSMPVSSKPSANTWWFLANTSGNTPTTDSTLALSAPRRSPFRLSGTIPRFPDGCFARAFRIIMGCRRWWSCPALRRDSSIPKLQESRSSPRLTFSALTTTSATTRQRTFNTSHGSKDHGLDSTGAMTAASLREPHRASHRRQRASLPPGRTTQSC
jgi:hypothetical protein